MNSRWVRNGLIYLVIIAGVIVGLIFLFNRGGEDSDEVPLSRIVSLARENGSATSPLEIVARGDEVTATDTSTGVEEIYEAAKVDSDNLYQVLIDAGIPQENYTYTVIPSGGFSRFFGILLTLLPILLIVGFLIFILRQAQGNNSQAFGFGKSRARVFVGARTGITFYDVAGVPEAKEELEEVVDFLKFPERFQALGARIPKGVLMVGPPGTGKTLLARAVAGEAGVPFFSISGSEFVEMFVGVGASRVRDLFEQAKRHSPCIVFVDEVDAVGRHRGAGVGGGNDEREQTLNQILVEMDGFDTNTNVIVVAATNRPDILDPALLRPGRFDRRVVLDTPDVAGRAAIMNVHAKGKPFEDDVELDSIGRQTPGFSGADLANLINEAALLAARRKKKSIGMGELTEAIDRVSIGPARKSKVISKEEREMVAYHESGHAVVSHFISEGKPIGKISIISRGHAGGFTRYEQEERSLHTSGELEALIASAMGGRVAEVIKFGKITTGATNDIENATRIARSMVTRFGMSETLGARLFGKKEEAIFLGREMSEQRDYSLRTEVFIDKEIDALLKKGQDEANRILVERKAEWETLTQYLLKYETIEAEEFKLIMNGGDLDALKKRYEIKAAEEEAKAKERESGNLRFYLRKRILFQRKSPLNLNPPDRSEMLLCQVCTTVKLGQ